MAVSFATIREICEARVNGYEFGRNLGSRGGCVARVSSLFVKRIIFDGARLHQVLEEVCQRVTLSVADTMDRGGDAEEFAPVNRYIFRTRRASRIPPLPRRRWTARDAVSLSITTLGV
jgi:hypothetical protein